MIWGPFLLALALGLVVSAGLYFAYLWPQVEPDDEAIDAASAGTAATDQAPAKTDDVKTDDAKTADAKDAEAADAKPDDTASTAESEAETEAKAPSSESSPA